ncbi:hypothetical protein [Microbacterium excoecariae]|uniref:hypothetical protein n=1 Tax=Microbacterium excoecariae TaxID=2715210 RepID=UPI00140D89A4|nr:hypothetical protein [Microbacterium excoecariae]NHI16848.1 hypothetical protein [Microbacterium excoecariae]
MNRIEEARARVQRAEEALAAWDDAHQLTPIDPGMQSRRFHVPQARLDKELATYLNRVRQENTERALLVGEIEKAKRAARVAEIPSEPVDPAALKGAIAVMVVTRGHAEWHRVIRVNKTTVTCWAPPGFDQPRHPHSRIYAVRHEAGGHDA